MVISLQTLWWFKVFDAKIKLLFSETCQWTKEWCVLKGQLKNRKGQEKKGPLRLTYWLSHCVVFMFEITLRPLSSCFKSFRTFRPTRCFGFFSSATGNCVSNSSNFCKFETNQFYKEVFFIRKWLLAFCQMKLYLFRKSDFFFAVRRLHYWNLSSRSVIELMNFPS